MPATNILASFNGTDTSKSALKLACQIALRHDAHLTGLFAHAMPTAYFQAEPYMPPDTLAMLSRHEVENEDRVRAEFQKLIEANGMHSRVTFYVEEGQPNDVCSYFARTHDLAIIGQAEGEFWEVYREPHPDTVAFQSGRAVLIAPKAYDGEGLSKEAVLAWDGGRAAARALAEAMALLPDVDRLLVLHIGDDDAAIRKPGCDIMEHLSRHGIHAELRVVPRSHRSVGQALLEACDAVGTHLLVMGAYERSRFSESLFGGVTKDVVAGAAWPVLMAH